MTTPQDIAGLHAQMKEAVKANWKAFLIEGIVLVILGMAAIAISLLASIAVFWGEQMGMFERAERLIYDAAAPLHAAPPDDPPVERVVSQGLRHGPKASVSVVGR